MSANNSNSKSKSNSNSNSNSFENQLLTKSQQNVDDARETHKRALKALGDAKKHHIDVKKKIKQSKKLSKLINRNDISNISAVRNAYNNAIKSGLPKSYGSMLTKKLTSVGKAGEILAAFNNMQSVKASIKNPTMRSKVMSSLAETMKISSGKQKKIANHNRLESAYEKCETYGIVGKEMNETFSNLADMENTRSANQMARNNHTKKLMKSMPASTLVTKNRSNMIYRRRHQPDRIRSSVFSRNGSKLRAHSVANIRNAHRIFKKNPSRQDIGHGNLPQVTRIRNSNKSSSRRKSN